MPRSEAQQNVERRLRSCLSRGCYPPGAPLTLLVLRRDFGVSDSVTRKVVQRLVAEGTLERAGRSATVPATPSLGTTTVPGPCPHSARSHSIYPPRLDIEAARRLRQRLASHVYADGSLLTAERLATDLGVPVACAANAAQQVAREGTVTWEEGHIRVPWRRKKFARAACPEPTRHARPIPPAGGLEQVGPVQ